jgi:hypothetical protein
MPAEVIPHPSLVYLEQIQADQKAWFDAVSKHSLQAFVPRDIRAGLDFAQELTGKKTGNGMANVERFDDSLEYVKANRGVKLATMQEKLINVGRIVMLKKIFGDSFAQFYAALKRKYNFDTVREQAAVILPRRSGKTVAQSLLAAVSAVTQPDGNVINFALQGRQAEGWLTLVYNMLLLFKDSEYSWTIGRHSSREFIEIINCCGTKVRISCFPGPRDEDASNYRGVGDKLLLLLYDEFYFFKECVYRTTLPLLKMDAGLLMTSSMSRKGDNPIQRMIFQKLEDNTDLFLRVDWIRACPDCVEAGTAESCQHVLVAPQHFESMGAMRRIGLLMTPFGAEDFMRELMNAFAKSTRMQLFDRELVAPLRDRNFQYETIPMGAYPYFFVGFDPAGGGHSNSVIVSVLFDTSMGIENATCVVLSTEVLNDVNLTTYKCGNYLIEHAERIRYAIPGLRSATAVFCIENNSLLVADSVAEAIQQSDFMNYAIMCENRKRAAPNTLLGTESVVRAGIRTVHKNKEEIMMKIRKLLSRHSLRIHRDFFFPHPEMHFREGVTVDVAKDQFVDEVANMHMYEDKSRKPVTNRATVWKIGGFTSDGQQTTDDKVMALGFCLLCFPLYLASPNFHAMRG